MVCRCKFEPLTRLTFHMISGSSILDRLFYFGSWNFLKRRLRRKFCCSLSAVLVVISYFSFLYKPRFLCGSKICRIIMGAVIIG